MTLMVLLILNKKTVFQLRWKKETSSSSAEGSCTKAMTTSLRNPGMHILGILSIKAQPGRMRIGYRMNKFQSINKSSFESSNMMVVFLLV